MQGQTNYIEKDLLALVADGDHAAFHRLYDQYRDKIFSMGMYITRSTDMADELVQDVFMRVWENRGKLREVVHFNAWLRTIAHNRAMDFMRKVAIEHLGLASLSRNPGDDHNTPEIHIVNQEYERVLRAAIDQLSPQQKRIFLLQRQEGLKQDDIARRLGISVPTVKEHMQLAMRSIRKYVDSYLEVSILIAIALYL